MAATTRNILIVDDRAPNRAYLTTLLASRGYTTVEAVDGMDALDALRTTKADLVLADILMPRMDGYEFVRRLRQEPALSSIPVILLTAHYLEAKARVLAESFGVSFVITKPVEPSVILDSVARALEQPSVPRLGTATLRIASDDAERHATPQYRDAPRRANGDTERRGAHPTAESYSDQHRRLLTDTLAYKAEQLEVANDRLRGLVSLGRRLASERSPRRLLSLFVSAAGDLVGAAYVLIAIREQVSGVRHQMSGLSERHEGAEARSHKGAADSPSHRLTGSPHQTHIAPHASSIRHIVVNGLDPAVVGRISSGGAVHELMKNFGETPDPTAIDLKDSAEDATLLPEEFRSLKPGVVIAPIATASQHYGLIVFGGVNLGSKPADSIESLAQSMGAVLAVAYENALRYEQIEHHAGRLQDEIAERRVAEERIARLNAELEERVTQRTAELERSHERLRQSERMASLGTLCAGLGHDMGNLLLPIRVRLDLLESSVTRETPADAHEAKPEPLVEHVNSIRECLKYIGDLTSGLRLLSLDADDCGSQREMTSIREWWDRVQPLLRSALPTRIALEAILPDEELTVALPQPRLTQAVFNLIQNAGDAMRSNAGEESDPRRVTVRVDPQPSAGSIDEGIGDDDNELRDWIELSVMDNGPGMSDEVRRRALEPYFTTKSRRLSTGLGLALVHGIILSAKGHVDIESTPGVGTTVRLMLPRAQSASRHSKRRPGALVTVADPRLRALTVSMMKMLGFQVTEDERDVEVDASSIASSGASNEVWITDAPRTPPKTIEAFLESGDTRQVALIGEAHGIVSHPRCADLGTSAREVRSNLRHLFAPRNRGKVADTSSVG